MRFFSTGYRCEFNNIQGLVGLFVSLCFGLGGEKFGLWEFKLFKSECILGDIAFGSMV